MLNVTVQFGLYDLDVFSRLFRIEGVRHAQFLPCTRQSRSCKQAQIMQASADQSDTLLVVPCIEENSAVQLSYAQHQDSQTYS